MSIPLDQLKDFLDYKVQEFNTSSFISDDPVSLIHRYQRKEDIEIVGFLVATIAWGNRKAIIKSGEKLLSIMGESPFEFVMNYESPTKESNLFVHRTFNAIDLHFIFKSLRDIYEKEGMENTFKKHPAIEGATGRIIQFRKRFFSISHEKRTEKHVSNPEKGAAAKRLQMMLRWFCRSDGNGVDVGIWKSISPSELNIPLDVHTANISRKLGLITRKQNDLKTLEELMLRLREFDPNDPSKYDYALFGLGAIEGF
ncbi:MAG: TIGR02757 family protein [Crocinitomicaceae bacterium]|jgi:uncharacterized protein (TIGR02757 family)